MDDSEIEEPVVVPPVEVVNEKKTLMSKLHIFEKRDNYAESAVLSESYSAAENKQERKTKIVIEPSTPLKKVEVLVFAINKFFSYKNL